MNNNDVNAILHEFDIYPKNELVFVEADHKYYLNGQPVPSVTTIIGSAPKHFGFRYDSSIPKFVLRAAGDRGTSIHLAIEKRFTPGLEIPERFVKLAEKHHGFLDAFDAFLDEHEYYPLEHETRMHLDGRYCGTIDAFGDLDGLTTIVDYKTQSKPSEHKWLLQLAAYHEMHRQETGFNYEQAAIIWLKKTGEYELFVYSRRELQEAFRTFEQLLAYAAKKEDKVDGELANELCAIFNVIGDFEPGLEYDLDDVEEHIADSYRL